MNRDPDLLCHTRAQALAGGVLAPITRQASPAEMLGGWTIPVPVTATVWAAIESIPDRLAGIADVRGRLHGVVRMAAGAARRSLAVSPRPRGRRGGESSRCLADPPASGGETARGNRAEVAVRFRVVLPRAGVRARLVTMRLDIGPDDDGARCATIGYPEDF